MYQYYRPRPANTRLKSSSSAVLSVLRQPRLPLVDLPQVFADRIERVQQMQPSGSPYQSSLFQAHLSFIKRTSCFHDGMLATTTCLAWRHLLRHASRLWKGGEGALGQSQKLRVTRYQSSYHHSQQVMTHGSTSAFSSAWARHLRSDSHSTKPHRACLDVRKRRHTQRLSYAF